MTSQPAPQANNMQPQTDSLNQQDQQAQPKKKGNNVALKVIVWIVVILVIIVLGLVISAFIAGFSSVFEMIDWIIAQIK